MPPLIKHFYEHITNIVIYNVNTGLLQINMPNKFQFYCYFVLITPPVSKIER